MAAHRKSRPYDASRRHEAAERTRHVIVQAAHARFVAKSWAGTTMAAIARDARVALDTVYATVGTKSGPLRLLIERALSGVDEPVPAEGRAYVKAIQDAPDAPTKIAPYAAALRIILPRLAPLVHVLQAASGAEPALDPLWREISERRARNMRLFAADLVKTGALRPSRRGRTRPRGRARATRRSSGCMWLLACRIDAGGGRSDGQHSDDVGCGPMLLARQREDLIDRPLVIDVLAVLAREDAAIAGDEEVSRQAEATTVRVRGRRPLPPSQDGDQAAEHRALGNS